MYIPMQLKTCIDSGQLLQNVFEFIDSKNCISVTISKIKFAVLPLFKEIKKCLLEHSNIFFGFSLQLIDNQIIFHVCLPISSLQD